MKSTVDEIRARFDNDVERFSILETGQSATIDAPLVMDLICCAAAQVTPAARRLLDIGCGAGNYSLKLLQKIPGPKPQVDVTLIDLSQPMLDRAKQRVSALTSGKVTPIQADIRDLPLESESFDIVLAAAVLHHLRDDSQWLHVFEKIHRSLFPGGSFWIADLIEHPTPAIQQMMWQRYGEYLTQLRDAAYRDAVFAYVEKEDTPRPLLYQIDLMRSVGFTKIEILHKNGIFAAFGGVK